MYYYHGDHLGSSNAITNRSGNFHEHVEYFPYGETWVEERVAGGENMPHKFTGKEQDPETGLYYYGHRYRDPKLGDWLSVDPAFVRGEYFPSPNDFDTEHDYYWYLQQDSSAKLTGVGGVFNPVNLNVYHYAGQNPVKMVDPDGNYSMFVELPTNRNETGTLSLYNDSGKLVGTYTVLGKGIHSDRMRQNGDTPTGIFGIVGRGEFSESSAEYRTFGSMFLALKPEYGEAKKALDNGRGVAKSDGGTGRFGLHGGDELSSSRRGVDPKQLGAFLRNTWGCLRGGNEDIADIQNKIKEIKKQRGHRTGQDPKVKDTVHVFDSKK